MELHFCSQCGISIPLAEVQSGAALGPDGRMVCAEHRGARTTAAPSGTEVELLFCANCQVSIPVADVQSGRAKQEFGSLLCSACSVADTAERERRRKAVEAAMADDAPAAVQAAAADAAPPRSCAVCAAAVPPAQIAAGRALVQGDRVVCSHCRDAGAGRAAPIAAGRAASAPSWPFLALLFVACGAAGYFGTAYYKAQSAPREATVGERDLAALRADIDLRLREASEDADRRLDEVRAAQREGADATQNRVAEDLVDLRADLADVRSRLTNADADLAKALARLEGQVGNMQEMIKGLAARPSGEAPRTAPPEGVRPPEGPPPDTHAPPVAPPDAELTALVKTMLESKDEGDRFNATVEIGRLKKPAAIPALAKVVVADPNVMVRRAAARALGEVRAWAAVPVLIQALEDREAYVAQQANFALQATTGQDFGVTIDQALRDRRTRAAAATKWWEKNKDSPPDGVSLEPVEAK